MLCVNKNTASGLNQARYFHMFLHIFANSRKLLHKILTIASSNREFCQLFKLISFRVNKEFRLKYYLLSII